MSLRESKAMCREEIQTRQVHIAEYLLQKEHCESVLENFKLSNSNFPDEWDSIRESIRDSEGKIIACEEKLKDLQIKPTFDLEINKIESFFRQKHFPEFGDLIYDLYADQNFDFDEEILRKQLEIISGVNTNHTHKAAAICQWKSEVENILSCPKHLPCIPDEFIVHNYLRAASNNVLRKESRQMEQAVKNYMSKVQLREANKRDNEKMWLEKEIILSQKNQHVKTIKSFPGYVITAFHVNELLDHWNSLIKFNLDYTKNELLPMLKQREKLNKHKNAYVEIVAKPLRSVSYKKYYRLNLENASEKNFFNKVSPLLEGSELIRRIGKMCSVCHCKLHKTLSRIEVKHSLKPGLDLVMNVQSIQKVTEPLVLLMDSGQKIELTSKSSKVVKEWFSGIQFLLKHKQSLSKLSSKIETYTTV